MCYIFEKMVVQGLWPSYHHINLTERTVVLWTPFFCTNIHHFWVKQECFWVARVLGKEYFWNASKLVRCQISWMITNRHQKKQSNISCIPDGDVHAFHHEIFYLALKEFERESFLENVLFFSVVCLSHSLSVVLATSLLLFLCLVLSCVSGSLRSLRSLRSHRSHRSLRSLRSHGSHGSLGKKETHET